MPIAFDAWVDGGNAFGNLTWNHTVTGTNPILFVGYETVGASVVSGITYNAIPMSRIGSEGRIPAGNYGGMFMLANPPTGTNSIVMSQAGTSSNSAESVSYTGTNPTSQPDASTQSSIVSGTTITETVTTIADNCWTVMWLQNDANASSVVGNVKRSPAAHGRGIFDSNSPISPAGSTSLVSGFTSSSVLATMASFSPFSFIGFSMNIKGN